MQRDLSKMQMSARHENKFEVQDQCYHDHILRSKLVRSPMPSAVKGSFASYNYLAALCLALEKL